MNGLRTWRKKRAVKLLAVSLAYFIVFYLIYLEQTLVRFWYDLETSYRYGDIGPNGAWERLQSEAKGGKSRPKIAILARHGNQMKTNYAELMKCYRNSKMEYAKRWDLVYLDDQKLNVQEGKLLPGRGWMYGRKKGRYSKFRFIEFVMRNQHLDEDIPNDIDWFLWMDGDTLFTNPDVSIYDRLSMFEKMYERQVAAKDQGRSNDLVLVLAKFKEDDWNDGVFFLRNSVEGYKIIYQSYHMYVPVYDSWADQRSLMTLLKENQQIMESTLLLSHEDMHYLQRYSPRSRQNWIAHFPGMNHAERTKSARQFCPAYNIPTADFDENKDKLVRIMKKIVDFIPVILSLLPLSFCAGYLSLASTGLLSATCFQSLQRKIIDKTDKGR
mmetsp:Transcript_4074/g.4995  ORF Transcript_4074/g.4995 Transcript_4074/m.4995 type:complete len:383 (+) Transcript_4074:121-1269(+)